VFAQVPVELLQTAIAFGWLQSIQAAPQREPSVVGKQALPHAWSPLLQVNPQLVPLQVGVLSGGGAHAAHDVAPQLEVLELDTQAPLQLCEPLLHVNPQVVPLQVGVLLAGGVHATHDVAPQLEVLELDTQAPLQLWKPVLQVKPQEVPLQVGVLLAGVVHATHDVPQLAGLVFDAQVPAQLWKPALQVIPHVPVTPLHTAVPFGPGVGHATQVGPQKLVLVSLWQMPLQLCVPVGHTPLQAFAFGMHAPAHSLLPVGHAGTHAKPSHVTVPPPVGAWQAVHDVLSLGPQVAGARLSTHLPLHTWNPLLHMRAQVPAAHAAAPFGSVGHITHATPQPVASLSGAQRLVFPVPQRWVPGPHVKSHVVPSQVATLAPVGLGHATQPVPHELTLVLDAQMPLQSCVPAGHTPEHAAAMSMHAPAQSFIAAGQTGTHMVPSQVTVPPIGIWHAEHNDVPQLPTSRLLTHRPPQMCCPALQESAQVPPTHWAVPFGSVGQAVQAVPHAVASSSRAHRLPHLW
jgi:hypothetical protein